MMRASEEPSIIAQTDDYVVINKPPGLLVHEAASSPDEATLADWLRAQFPQVATVGDEPETRPGIMHRLDREASGVMVVALTQRMFDHLKAQFQEHTVDKQYLALVYGRVKNDFGEIDLPIARKEVGGRMAARPIGDPDAREAHTEYQIDTRYTTATLLRVKISTGRSHQIRVHMFALQHPLVGDTLYTKKGTVGKSFPQPERLYLHATRIAFQDLSGEVRVFELPLPPDFVSYLHKLKVAV